MTSRCLLAALAVTALLACATANQKRAEAAFARGDYLGAAELYDQAVHEKPDSAKLIGRRRDARGKAVAELVDRAMEQRHAGRVEPALAAARAAVEARSAWFAGAEATQLPADVAYRVDELSAWAAAEVSRNVRRELDAARPLAAQVALETGRPLFVAAGLRGRADALASELTAAGSARCAELGAALPGGAAHLVHWVARYCKEFAAAAPVVPPSPEQISALKIQADTLGPTSAEQRERLEQRIEELLIASPWFHPQAPELAAARIAGTQVVAYSARPAERSVRWMERVPYHVQESYRESYTEMEQYSTQEPYTEYHSQSYSCGYGTYTRTCSRSVPTTRYRTAYKTRPVTKYRTKWRTVTRYRDEPRIFTHSVVEHHGTYQAAWDVALSFPAATPELALRSEASDERSADEHDVSFVQANVHPVKAQLASADDWFDERLGAFAREFPGRAQRHWVGSFCADGTLAMPEPAARCAHGAGAQTPEQAWAALSAYFKDDARLLSRPRT